MRCASFCAMSARRPGRSAHRLSLGAGRIAFRCRRALAELFGIEGDPGRIAFHFNATHALNVALQGVLRPGDRVIRTPYDHNAVRRPVAELRERGVRETVLGGFPDGSIDLSAAERALAGRGSPARLLVLPPRLECAGNDPAGARVGRSCPRPRCAGVAGCGADRRSLPGGRAGPRDRSARLHRAQRTSRSAGNGGALGARGSRSPPSPLRRHGCGLASHGNAENVAGPAGSRHPERPRTGRAACRRRVDPGARHGRAAGKGASAEGAAAGSVGARSKGCTSAPPAWRRGSESSLSRRSTSHPPPWRRGSTGNTAC